MPLPWVRLDSNFPQNPKILDLLAEKDGHRAAFVYLCGLAYSGAHGTDGYLPRGCLVFLHAKPADAAKLVKHGLWHEDIGGWLVHGWSEFQLSSMENEARRERARAAARRRWGLEG
jgi:hypothetical protein